MTGKVTTSTCRHGIDPPRSPSLYCQKIKGRCGDEDSHRAGYPGRPLGDSYILTALSHQRTKYHFQYKPLIEEALNRKVVLSNPASGIGDTDNMYLVTLGYSFDTTRKR
jgi:hypothetical protein